MGSIIAKENMRVGLKAKDWTDAIRLSGAVLEEVNAGDGGLSTAGAVQIRLLALIHDRLPP